MTHKTISNRWPYTALLVLLAGILCFCPAASAEEQLQKPSVELMTPIQAKMQQPVSIEFNETPIDNVLRILAKQADVDIVKSPKVTGVVTATLTDIPLSEALSNILSAHGYGYIATKNMIRVVPQEDIIDTREPFVSRIYRVTYADVVEVEKALKKFISQETGSISANPGTSNIIVTDVESKIKAVDSFIAEIDRITPQILVEAKIYDIKTTDALDIGIDWNAGRNTTLGTNVGDNPTAGRMDPFIKSVFGGVTGYTTANGQIRFGVLNDAIDIDAQLKLVQEGVTAKLLASPSVLSLDNEMARFKIVSEIPYQELTETSAGGSIGTTAFREVGVELTVIPHVTQEPGPGTEGIIRLRVQPKFSVAAGEVQVGNENLSNAQPVVDSREADLITLLKDGQTMVIAGLRKKDVNSRHTKIPLLGDIPLIGGLFQSENEETVNSQLFVFITAKIIQNQQVPTTGAHERAIEELDMKDIPPSKPLKIDRAG